MQAVILAAGRGTRMKELTNELPKPMLTVAGKSLLQHKLEALPDEVDEVIIVIGYQGDRIKEHLGDSYAGKHIRYVVQEELNGTAGALWLVRQYLTGRFMVLMGDDLYSKEDLETCIAAPDWVMLVEHSESMGSGGKIVTDEDGGVVSIEEGKHEGPGLKNTNFFVLDERLFEHEMLPANNGTKEYGLPQTILSASKAAGISLHAITATKWIQITSPEDLSRAEALLA